MNSLMDWWTLTELIDKFFQIKNCRAFQIIDVIGESIALLQDSVSLAVDKSPKNNGFPFSEICYYSFRPQ